MKICPNCQHQSSDESSFCMNCGHALTEVAAPAVPVAEPAVQPVEPAPEPQPVAAPMPTPVPAPQPYAQQAPYGQPPYSQPYEQQPQAYMPPVVADPYDHTAEFDPKDISDHKVYCMLCYLMGPMGIIIALLAGKDSPYTQFHVRTAIKFVVAETLLGILTLFLFWTVIFALVGGIMLTVLGVLQIVCFFQICSGKAKDPAIIRSLGFLN